MLEMFQTLYRYNWWATTRILEAVKDVPASALQRDLGGSFPSIHTSLLHILWAELMFLKRWQGQTTEDLAQPPKLETIEAIQSAWQQLENKRGEYFKNLTEAELYAPIVYNDSRGRRVSLVLWQALFHCANHSTFHRGQIITKLRQIGITPPSTDFVVFCRENTD